jgi:hypothetical protein
MAVAIAAFFIVIFASLWRCGCVVSLNGHKQIKRWTNFLDRTFLVPPTQGRTRRIFTATVIVAILSVGAPALVQAAPL